MQTSSDYVLVTLSGDAVTRLMETASRADVEHRTLSLAIEPHEGAMILQAKVGEDVWQVVSR